MTHIAVTGATGLIGSALVRLLVADGHTVTRLLRRAQPGPGGTRDVIWDPERGAPDAALFDGVDVVVHLAGENIAERWTAERKRAIRRSRVDSTRALASTLAGMRAGTRTAPRALVVASAVGIYGDRGDELLDERSAPGTGFLADVTREWEDAARAAADAGLRVVHTRFGIVLAGWGGALAKMLPPFRLGAGGRLGDGRQWMSWASIMDVALALRFAITTDSLAGAVNVTSPQPVTNADFTHTLGHVLHRPTVATVPAFALRLLFGREMADETLLVSQRVLPHRLESAGFRFRYPALEPALEEILHGQLSRNAR